MEWRFAIFAAVISMFWAFSTHVFGINAGLVFNDRYNLDFVLNPAILGRVSEEIIKDMFGAAPLSQPWVRASFIADHNEYHADFVWYHVIEVMWHALATGLFFFVVLNIARHLRHQNRLKIDPYHLATVAAVLFACHPFACETVGYLSCRTALLGAINFFQAVLFFLIASNLKNRAARLCFIGVALYSAAMSVWSSAESLSLPAMALISLLLIKRPLAKWQQTLKQHPFMVSLMALLSVGVPCLALLPLRNTTACNLFLPTLSSAAYAASQLKGFVFYYLRCFCLPLGYSIDPQMAVASSFSDPFVIGALVIIAFIIGLLVKAKQPILWFAALLVLAGYLPHAVMLQPDAVADWVVYLPAGGVMIFFAYWLCRLSQLNMKAAVTLFLALDLVLAGLSIARDLEWDSSYSLYKSALSLNPNSAFLHATMAMEELNREELDAAEADAKQAIGAEPDMVVAKLAQAKVKIAREKFDDADKLFSSALELAQKQKLAPVVRAECRLGQLQCLIGQRKEKEANALLAKLLSEIPGEARLLYQLGLASFGMHDYEKSFQFMSKAVENNPALTECWLPMTESALTLGAYDAAYKTAHSYADSVGGPNSRLFLARAAMLSNHPEEAEEVLKQLVQDEPKNARAQYLLSRLYKRLGKADEAKKYLADAEKLDAKIVSNYPLPDVDADDAAHPPGKAEGTEGKGNSPAKTDNDGKAKGAAAEPASPPPSSSSSSSGGGATSGAASSSSNANGSGSGSAAKGTAGNAGTPAGGSSSGKADGAAGSSNSGNAAAKDSSEK